jgi:hypothetical protein
MVLLLKEGVVDCQLPHAWKGRGLCLCSTATQNPKALLRLQCTTHQGRLTSPPSCLTEADEPLARKERFDTENVLPHRGFSMGTHPFSCLANAEANCLSLANQSA